MTESDTKAKATKRSRSTRFLINAALTMASVLVLVIVLEIAVRVFLPQRHGLAYTHFDPELGWMQKPNSEYYYQRENKQPSHVSTNAHGLRTPDIPLQKEDSVFRVLFIGDSFVQALAVDDDSTFCRRLELALNEQTDDHEFQIVNGGVDGFSPVQEMLLLERFISVYNPDLVVQLFFAGNDFVDNADRAGRRRPMGRIDDTGELIVIPPTPQDGFLSRNRDRLLEKSQLAFLLRVKIIPRTEILATVAQRLGLARYSGLRSRNFDIEKEWPKYVKSRLDMGKSCVRFKKLENLALDVVGQVIARVPAKAFIANYQATLDASQTKRPAKAKAAATKKKSPTAKKRKR